MRRCATPVLLASVLASGLVYAGEVPFTQEDRDRLIRLEATLQEFMKRVDDRFEAVDKRFEQVDKRFEQVDKRFEQVDKRFEQVNERFRDILAYMAILAGAFAAIVATTIGFAIWDRKTVVAPVRHRTERLEQDLAQFSDTARRQRQVEDALRQYAETEPRLADILRRCGML